MTMETQNKMSAVGRLADCVAGLSKIVADLVDRENDDQLAHQALLIAEWTLTPVATRLMGKLSPSAQDLYWAKLTGHKTGK